MALYAAKKILFSDEFAFCLRRCNDESVSSTWDWMQVYPVVFDAYAQLIEWHKINYPEDKEAIVGAEKSLLRRISLTIREVYEHNKADLKELKDLVNSIIGEGTPLHSLLNQYPQEVQTIRSLLWTQRIDFGSYRSFSLKTFAMSHYLAFLNKILGNYEESIRGNLL